MLAGMTQKETDIHNTNHCKSIAEKLQKHVDGEIYHCSYCGQDFEMESNNDVCPECGKELEQATIEDWLKDILDFEIRSGLGGEYRSAELTLTWGGPNIYLDTQTEKIKLYWYTDTAEACISREVANEIDNYVEELWNCR